MFRSKSLSSFSLCVLLVSQAISSTPNGFRPYQDLVNVCPGLRGADTFVNVVTGQLIHVRQDLHLPGRGLPLTVVFTYIGSGWQMNYQLRYTANLAGSGDCYVNRANGNVDHFIRQADGSYTSTWGVRDELKDLDAGYRLTVWHDGVNNQGDYAVYTYDNPDHPCVTHIADRNGNGLTFTYDSDQNLEAIADASGRTLTFTHNVNGKVTGLLDPAGRQWYYRYDDQGNMIQVTDPAGGVVRYAYAQESHLCTGITDARGHTWHFDYAEDRVSAVTDPLGRTAFVFTYDTTGAGRTQVTDGNDNRTTYHFNHEGRVTAIDDAQGNTTTRVWDDQYHLVSVTDRNGHTSTSSYDNRGNLLSHTNPLGHTVRYTWDPRHNTKTGYTDENGNTTTYGYDTKGNLLTQTDALGHKTTYTYDAFGQITSATDALGNTTRFEYGDSGNRTKVIDALGERTLFSYDMAGNLVSKTNADGQTTRYEYDTLSRLSRRIDALGGTLSFAYDAVGNLVSTTDEIGHVTSYTFNALNRLITQTNAEGESTTYTYDPVGNRLTRTDNAGRTTRFTYDALKRMIAQEDPAGARIQYACDARGDMIAKTDANGNVTKYNYDGLGRLTSITDALGGVTRYVYDASGNRVSRTTANGNTTQYTYDALGRKVKRVTPMGNTWQYAYDAGGNLVRRTDANGDVTSYVYDALHRRTETVYADGSVTWTYDACGRLTGVRNGLGLRDETTYAYDALGRVVFCTTEYGTALDAQRVTYAYDAAGRRIKTTYPLGRTLQYHYDRANRLVRIDGFDGTTTYTLDGIGRRVAMAYPNGMSVTYAYDEAGQTTRLTATDPDGGRILEETYAYDAIGNKVYQSRDRDNSHREIEYDATNRIASVTYHRPDADTRTYTYDAAGRRLTETVNGATTTFTYDADGRVIQQSGPEGVTTYQYDRNGNRIRQTGPEGTTAYTFDHENRIIEVSLPTVYPARMEYAYCAQGRKLLKQIETWPTYYTYDDAALITEQGPMWNGNMWQIFYNPQISATEDEVPIYPVYTTGHTSVAEVYPLGSWDGETVHLLEFDEFGVKIKGSYEGMTLFGGHSLDIDLKYFSNDYDPDTASKVSGSEWSGPMIQTGLNTWKKKGEEFNYDNFVVSDTSQLSQGDLIRLRDDINAKISVGFSMAPEVKDSFYHLGTKYKAEEIAVENTQFPLSSGVQFGIYATDSARLAKLSQEQQQQGLPGPVTHATRYSVKFSAMGDSVVVTIRNNLTGKEELGGALPTKALRENNQYIPLGPPDSSGVQRFHRYNPVWDGFAQEVVTNLRSVMERDQRRP